jgi:hypothetical protein
MVSQPSMRRTPGTTFCLLGLTASLVLFAACGQNEGGRCQIASDCASGLQCNNGATGNGTCGPQNVVVTQNDAALKDAALKNDVAEDVAVPLTSEVGSEAGVTPEVDGEGIDAGSVDSDSLDSTSID